MTRWKRVFQLGVGRGVPRRVLLEVRLQIGDTVAGQRVRAGKGGLFLLAVAVADFEVLQLLEELDAALAGDPGLGQVTYAGGIGRGFLRPAESQERAHGGLLAQRQRPHCRIPGPGSSGSDSDEQREDGDPGRRLEALVEANHVPADNVPQFVRQHALHFVGVICRVDQAGVDVDALSAGNEGVK